MSILAVPPVALNPTAEFLAHEAAFFPPTGPAAAFLDCVFGVEPAAADLAALGALLQEQDASEQAYPDEFDAFGADAPTLAVQAADALAAAREEGGW